MLKNQKQFLAELRTYENIIVYGFGNLGRTIVDQLLKYGIIITEVWDMRLYQTQRYYLNIPINKPFERIVDNRSTFFIVAIGNNHTFDKIVSMLENHRYTNFVKGNMAFQILLCSNTSENFKIRECLINKNCLPYHCDKYNYHIGATAILDKKDALHISVLEIRVGMVCNLRCKYCIQYLTHYPAREIINFQVDRLCEDIEKFIPTIDFIDTISLIGGEPFLYKDLYKVLEKLLDYKNIGYITIVTNGLAKIDPGLCTILQSERILVNISDYRKMIKPSFYAAFDRNIEFLSMHNINYRIQQLDAVWAKPNELLKKNQTLKEIEKVFEYCQKVTVSDCVSLVDGKFFLCSRAVALNSLKKIDIANDYVNVRDNTDTGQLRINILDLLNRKFLYSCDYCSFENNALGVAGEQI